MYKTTLSKINKEVETVKLKEFEDSHLPYKKVFFDKKDNSFAIIHDKENFQYTVILKDFIDDLAELDIKKLMDKNLYSVYQHLARSSSKDRLESLVHDLLTLRSLSTVTNHIEVWELFKGLSQEEGDMLDYMILSFSLYGVANEERENK